jgi:hypothetical protein
VPGCREVWFVHVVRGACSVVDHSEPRNTCTMLVLVLPRTCVAGMHGLGLRSEIDLSWWMVVGWRAAVAGRATRLAQQQSDLAKGG